MNKVYLKQDIVRYLSRKSGYSQAVSRDVLNAYHDLMIEAVENGDKIQDFGFIDIKPVFVKEHFRTDPRDNTVRVFVPNRYKLTCKMGKTVTDSLKRLNKTIK